MRLGVDFIGLTQGNGVELFHFNLFASTFYEKEEDLGQQFLPPPPFFTPLFCRISIMSLQNELLNAFLPFFGEWLCC